MIIHGLEITGSLNVSGSIVSDHIMETTSSYAITASYALNGGGGGGGGVTNAVVINQFNTYDDLISDTSLATGSFAIVSDIPSAIFIKLAEWFTIVKGFVFGVTSDTIGYYKMQGNADDSSTYSNHGTASNVTYEITQFSTSSRFNGTDSSIDIPYVITTKTSSVTMLAWVYLESTSTRGMFIKIGDQGTGYGIGVGTTANADNYGNNLIAIYEGVRWINGATNIGIGWHMIGLTIDASKVPSLWLDGKKVVTVAGTNPKVPSGFTAIGGYIVTGSTSYPRYTSCSLDEVIIENREWAEEEVWYHYLYTKPPSGSY